MAFPDDRGVSLIDLMAAVGVMGLLMAVTAPTFLDSWRNASLKTGAQEVRSLLHGARSIALRENTTVCVRADNSTTGAYGTAGAYGTRIRYFLGSCAGVAWVGAGTDSTGGITLGTGLLVQAPTSGVSYSHLGGVTTGGTFRVCDPRQPGRRADVTIGGAGRVSITYPGSPC